MAGRISCVVQAVILAALCASAGASAQAPPPPPIPSGISTAPAASAPEKRRCTIKGTKKDDVLRGTRKADVICSFGGRDRIRGGLGADQIRSGRGADRVTGGGGDDQVEAGPGGDLLNGADGDDYLDGGPGDDLLNGDDQDDYLDGGPGADLVDPGTGFNQCAEIDPADIVSTTCWSGFRIEGVRIEPSLVDTSGSDQTVQVTMTVTDTSDRNHYFGPEGTWSTDPTREPPYLAAIDLMPIPPRPYEFNFGWPDFRLSLVAGDASSGTWSGPVTLDKNSPTGVYEFGMELIEVVPGIPSHRPDFPYATQSSFLGFPELTAAGLPSAVTQVGASDPGPNLEGLEITPREIDLSSGDDHHPIEFDLVISQLDGVIDSAHIRFEDDSVRLNGDGGFSEASSSALVREVTWTVSGTVSPTAEAGSREIASIDLIDGDQVRSVDTEALRALGLDPSFEITE